MIQNMVIQAKLLKFGVWGPKFYNTARAHPTLHRRDEGHQQCQHCKTVRNSSSFPKPLDLSQMSSRTCRFVFSGPSAYDSGGNFEAFFRNSTLLQIEYFFLLLVAESFCYSRPAILGIFAIRDSVVCSRPSLKFVKEFLCCSLSRPGHWEDTNTKNHEKHKTKNTKTSLHYMPADND